MTIKQKLMLQFYNNKMKFKVTHFRFNNANYNLF
jgi:hypothetical protein